MIMIGYGYCFDSMDREEAARLTDWVDGTFFEAEQACCNNEFCAGVHFDTQIPDYVLLDAVGTPRVMQTEIDKNQGTRRECWQKIFPEPIPDGKELPTDDSPGAAPAPALVAAVAALAAVFSAE